MNITQSAMKILHEQLVALKALANNQFEWNAVFTINRILDRVEVQSDSALKLWFVKDTHPEFDTDRDLLVWASNIREATVIWREYYETDLEEQPKSVKEIQLGAVGSGAIPWNKLT